MHLTPKQNSSMVISEGVEDPLFMLNRKKVMSALRTEKQGKDGPYKAARKCLILKEKML